MIKLSEKFQEVYPNAHIGYLLMSNLENNKINEEMIEKKKQLEEDLRNKFEGYDRKALGSLDTIASYAAYYKKFKKTFHVLMQLEAIALKGKGLPNVDGLVESMFMAEVKNQLLTAGHDVSKVKFPIVVDVANGDETYICMNKKEAVCHSKDMYMKDEKGILSSVIDGPDNRSKIDMQTKKCLYVVYGPDGVEKDKIKEHLEDIKINVQLICKDAVVDEMQIL